MKFGEIDLGKWAGVSGCAQEQMMGTGQAVLLHSLNKLLLPCIITLKDDGNLNFDKLLQFSETGQECFKINYCSIYNFCLCILGSL